MNNYKSTVGIEPTDEYEKAKKDMINALRSIQAVNIDRRARLIYEAACTVLGFETAQEIMKIMQTYFG